MDIFSNHLFDFYHNKCHHNPKIIPNNGPQKISTLRGLTPQTPLMVNSNALPGIVGHLNSQLRGAKLLNRPCLRASMQDAEHLSVKRDCPTIRVTPNVDAHKI